MSPIFVIGTLLGVLFCGLSLDIGLLELQKTSMQTAADAAVIAEEMQFERGGIASLGSDAGLAAAAQYGYTDGVNNTTVSYASNLGLSSSVFIPATAGDYAGHYDAIQVLITRRVRTLFMGMISSGQVTISATAVAAPPPCQFFLGKKNLQTPTVMLADLFGVPASYAGCPTYIGGSLSVSGSGVWQSWQTYLTGSSSQSSLLGHIKQGTTFNAAARTDPLAAKISAPIPGGCLFNGFSSGSLTSLTSITLNPGTYCGLSVAGVVLPGMTLLGSNVTFNPGLYIITGGINWQLVSATGNGVTFFFTNIFGTANYGNLLISTLSVVSLRAATGSTFGGQTATGALSGVLFFLDRNWVNTSPQDFRIFTSSVTTNGFWYMPSTGLSIINASTVCNWNATANPALPVPSNSCGIIADNLFDSNSQVYTLGSNFSAFSGGSPLRQTSVLVQ